MKLLPLNLSVIVLVCLVAVYADQGFERELNDADVDKRTAAFDHEFLGGNLRFKRPLNSQPSADQYFKALDAAYLNLRNHLKKKKSM